MFWTKKDLKERDDINMCVVSNGSDIQAYEEAKMVCNQFLAAAKHKGAANFPGSSLHILASFVMRWYPMVQIIEENVKYNSEQPKDGTDNEMV